VFLILIWSGGKGERKRGKQRRKKISKKQVDYAENGRHAGHKR
jgi:hypothetical protein